jgi:hypothetical protein
MGTASYKVAAQGSAKRAAVTRRRQDTPRERVANLTRYWTVLGEHPLLVAEALDPVLVAQVEQPDDRPPTQEEIRAAAALWDARPVARASHRVLRLPHQETPALELYDVDPAQPNDADRQGPLISIYPDRCRGSLVAAIKALKATWHASYLPVGARVNNRPIDFEERMARYCTWWPWYQVQPEGKNGDDRFRAAVLAGQVGNVNDWAASRSGFLSGLQAARLWLHPVQSPLTAHEVIRHIS